MIEQIEQARQLAVAKQKKAHRITAVVGLCIFLVVFFLFEGGEFDVALLIPCFFSTLIPTVIVGIILTIVMSGKEVKAFQDLYKKHIVEATFKEVFDDVHFDVDKGIDYKVISDTGMLYMGDSFSSNDYVTGKYKDINFAMSDVYITETHTDSDGDSYTVTIFSGQWYIFDFNKTFKANVQVKDKYFSSATTRRKKGEEKYQKVEMEDIDFNKKFTCYAQDPLDAFYIVTPRMMEKLKKLKETMKPSLLFCFIDNKLHVGVYSHQDLFEPNLRKPVDLAAARATAMKDLQPIMDFVNGLELDNDLFKQ